MINKITFANHTPNFKAISPKEDVEIADKINKMGYNDISILEPIAITAGIGVGCICKLAKMKDPSDKGVTAYLTSLFALTIAKMIKNSKVNQEYYNKKYENEEEKENTKNPIKKFINLMASPAILDFGDEQRNKEYYDTYKIRNKIAFITTSSTAISAGIIHLLAKGICNAKKVADKDDTISKISFIGTMSSILLGLVINKIWTNKELENKGLKYNKNSENNLNKVSNNTAS